MWVVGTAGHVDHGKSTLVNALTGIHPDRLKEEKLREMTIDLGFAWLKLPGGESVGIVDVPGHRDFIENMLAGVGGIDGVLFVIAADEGIMPQTREHLAILDLLQVKAGIIVLTKVDLAPDEDWLQLVEHEIREFCSGTILENAPLVRVSAVTGLGIDVLKNEIAKMLAGTTEREDLGRPRLSIDRVFTISGYGTVVTGTLIDGKFTIGEEIQLLPGQLTGRIRGIQTYNQKVTEASPGTRTALNLAGIDRDQIRRGDVVSLPGKYTPSRRLDVQVSLLKDTGLDLKHNAEIKLFISATEVEGRIRLLGTASLTPGSSGFAQLELEHPVVAVKGDHFIIRRPSPPATIAGGVVVDPHPDARYKLNDPTPLQRLQRSTVHSPNEELLSAIDKIGIANAAEIVQAARATPDETQRLIGELLAQGALVAFEKGEVSRESLLISRTKLDSLTVQATNVLKAYHQGNPLKRGMLREEFKARLGLPTAVFARFLDYWVSQRLIVRSGQWLSLPQHTITYTPAQAKQIRSLMELYERNPFSPPSLAESIQLIGEALVNSLIESGDLVKVAPDVLFRPEALGQMSAFVRERSANSAPFTVGEFRDRFHTSRKYSLAFLEYLDELGATQREGEGRLLISPEKLP